MTARETAYRSLVDCERDGKYSNIELSKRLERTELSDADRALFTLIFYGVTEKKLTLDFFISHYSSKPIARLDRATLVLLRMGIYQILFADKIPDSAAVNETVKLAARYSARSKGFVNALLRKICAEKDRLPYPDEQSDPIKHLSVRYSTPEWICRLWQSDYPEQTRAMLEALSEHPPITLRTNTQKIGREALLEKCDALAPCDFSPYGVRLKRALPIDEISALARGEAFVQDEASQLAALALDPHENELVIDVCAAPGGKSFGAAMLMNDCGRVISLDVHENKLSLIKRESELLGLSSIETMAHDSTEPVPEFVGKADRVICDVPCSGLGVIAKKSDLRYRSEDGLDELCELQYKILCASAKYLKKGGVLVYSTCTLRKAENEDNVRRFIAENDSFALVPFTLGTITAERGMLTLFPGIYPTDGFFIAKLIKKA